MTIVIGVRSGTCREKSAPQEPIFLRVQRLFVVNNATAYTVPSLSQIGDTNEVVISAVVVDFFVKIKVDGIDAYDAKKVGLQKELVEVVRGLENSLSVMKSTLAVADISVGDIVLVRMINKNSLEATWAIGAVRRVAKGELTVDLYVGEGGKIDNKKSTKVKNANILLCSSATRQMRVTNVTVSTSAIKKIKKWFG